MGGNALDIETRRCSKVEYWSIANAISQPLKNNNIRYFITRCYDEKKDFGDLDVLISTESIKSYNDMFDFIINTYPTTEVSRNKSVISFEYDNFQVDFILMDEDCWDTAKIYYSFNDLGNLMGRIAASMGFRYGHDGLRYEYRHPDGGKVLKMHVSRDPEDIFTFLGFDYHRMRYGFRDLEEIFRYVIYSKFFNKGIFEYSALNHQNRTRNKKRKNYNLFLEYLEKKVLPIDFVDTDLTKEFFLDKAEDMFNYDIRGEIMKYNKKIEREKRTDITKERLNAEIIQEHFDISGREIGSGITKFKRDVEEEFDEPWQAFVTLNDVDVIMKFFCKYNNYYNKVKKEWLKY